MVGRKAVWGVGIVLVATAGGSALLALSPPSTDPSLPNFIAKVKPFEVEESAGLSASGSIESVFVSESLRLPMSFHEFLNKWDRETHLTPGSEAMLGRHSFLIWQDPGGGKLSVQVAPSGKNVLVVTQISRKATLFDIARFKINGLFRAKR